MIHCCILECNFFIEVSKSSVCLSMLLSDDELPSESIELIPIEQSSETSDDVLFESGVVVTGSLLYKSLSRKLSFSSSVK